MNPRSPHLSALIVAPSDDATQTVISLFSAAGTVLERQRVHTQASFRNALKDKPWDIGLYLPGVGALSVQACVRLIAELDLDLPLIVVAGQNDERGTRRAIEAGARDVIDYDRMERLLPAVEREVQEARHRADHRAALEMLKESEARFRTLAANLPGMLFQLRRDAQNELRFLYVSEGCTKLFGLKQQELLASANRFLEVFDADARRDLERAIAESAAKGSLLNWEGHTRGRSRKKWINVRSTPHHVEPGVIEWRGIATNITESKESETALRDSHRKLAELTAHLEEVKEQERERISRDIHDDLGALLVFIKIEASQLAGKLPKSDGKLQAKARAIEGLLDQAMSTANRVVRELRPGILKEFGLSAAIESQAEDFTHRFNIPCRVHCDDDIVEPEAETALALFRIAQEALTNIAKHAHASLVVMRLWRESGNIVFEIRDNGRGISDDDIQKPKSFGLRGIRERVLSLSGEFSVATAEQGGTHITLRIPERVGSEPEKEEILQGTLF